MTKIHHSDTLELVGKDEQIAADRWTEDVALTLPIGDVSGQILGINLTTRREATGGTVLAPSGTLMVFDADPGLTTGDAALVTGVHRTVLGTVAIATGDWYADVGGGVVYKSVLIPFYTLKTLYFAFFWTLSTSINSLGTDDEVMELDVQLRIEDKTLF